MLQDSDHEKHDLNTELKTWKKLEKNIKTIGFLNGVEKGKELSLQEGFNLGFSDGFKLGEYLGLVKGIMCYKSEQLSSSKKPYSNEETLNCLSNKKCVICSKEKISEVLYDKEMTTEKNEDLITTQQSHTNKMVATLKANLKSYIEIE